MSKMKLCVQLDEDSSPKQVDVYPFQDDIYLSLKETAELLGKEVKLNIDQSGHYLARILSSSDSTVEFHMPETMKQEIWNNITLQKDTLKEVNNQIFSRPELGNEEEFACKRIVTYLESLDLSVEVGLHGIDPQSNDSTMLSTAFKAVKKGKDSGPVITVMLEYDALPMGHACGHNLIAVSGLAAISALVPLMDLLSGELRVIGTPAEEGGKYGGKIPLLAAGHFRGSDIVLITHPGDRWDTGADFLAISGGRFTFYGVPSHASAAPEKGISALDAAILAYTNIETLREHLRDDARIHGIFKDGGLAPNIVPEQASLSYGVRALDQPYVDELKRKIEKCVQAGADAVGASADIQWTFGYSSPLNVPILDGLVRDIAIGLNIEGIKKWEALGSSDLGNVGFEIPTCNLWFKISPEGILPHTHEFLEAAGSDVGFDSAILAGYILALSAGELFLNPSKVNQIVTSFNDLKSKLSAT